ncbi:MAG: bifunctional (p)ppGpp synthetase/guanosine-3',5'-bis(diphosphate) 3'-pyrophosphohydrolase [Tidjanibacter sp.]|nr:bifunctional (p)ppGpp synthetase/guanosine-3',5'-bis(diphosphate) 3'-pyrophosphohydrolase [Tidjanibacter sp.]
MANYTPEDELIIEQKYNELLASCNKICKSESDWDMIVKAFSLAKDAHKGVRRRSGEPYILHPIAVAKIVVDEVGLGVKSTVAALLHDVVEDTSYTVEDMENLFGTKVASMVDGLTKVAAALDEEASAQAETFRKILLTLSDDIRVILIKISDRLHNMRTLGSMPRNKQLKITSETMYLFAPLAYRLGLYAIKTELEDLSLKYMYPDQYAEIEAKMNATAAERNEFIERFIAPIRERLTEAGIDFTVSGRVKTVFSVWSKMHRKQIPFEEIYDLFAIRIVFKPTDLVPEKSQCWHIYSLLTDIYSPKPDRIRDWVSFPKANGYEALHATLMRPDGIWAEVQIRSERMEEVAERGFAAHWKYKQAHESDDEFDKWLKDVRAALSQPAGNAAEFLENVKMTLYMTEMVVFTPKGETKKMPVGATALDFAYEIHTNVGNTAIGAKINHKIESIYTPLTSGDQIQILTAETAHPTIEWLDHVNTVKAKQSIISYLKRVRQNNIERGISIFDRRMREFGITPSARLFRKLLPAYECSNKDEFYSKLGSEIINLNDIDSILRQNSKNKILKFWTFEVGADKKNKELVVSQMTDIEGDDVQKFAIAECCNPIPGDNITGYRDPKSGVVVVHKTDCEELIRLGSQKGENLVSNIKWASYKAQSYLSEIEMRGIDRVGILRDLVQVITIELNVNIRGLQIQSHDGIFEGKISLYVTDTQNLNELIEKVNGIKGIEKVKRL